MLTDSDSTGMKYRSSTAGIFPMFHTEIHYFSSAGSSFHWPDWDKCAKFHEVNFIIGVREKKILKSPCHLKNVLITQLSLFVLLLMNRGVHLSTTVGFCLHCNRK